MSEFTISKNMTMAEFRAAITQEIEERFNNPTVSPWEKNPDAVKTAPIVDIYELRSRVVAPMMKEILDGVDFSYGLRMEDKDHLLIAVSKSSIGGWDLGSMKGNIPFFIQIRRKKTQSGRLRPKFVEFIEIGKGSWPEEWDNIPVRDFIASNAAKVFAFSLNNMLDIAMNYIEAVIYFRSHGISDMDELMRMVRRISRNSAGYLSDPPFTINRPEWGDGYDDVELPRTVSVRYSFAEEVFARIIDELTKEGSGVDLPEKTVARLNAIRPQLKVSVVKPMYLITGQNIGHAPMKSLFALVGKETGNKKDMSDLYTKMIFSDAAIELTPIFNYRKGITEDSAVDEEKIRAIDKPGQWFAFDYKTGLVTTGAFSDGKEIPALDNNMILVLTNRAPA